jgi:hypothetical protein
MLQPLLHYSLTLSHHEFAALFCRVNVKEFKVLILSIDTQHLQDYFLPALVELTHIDVRKAGI